MATRNIKKSLIVEDDIAHGEGTVTQERNGVSKLLNKLSLMFGLSDMTKFANKSGLFDGQQISLKEYHLGLGVGGGIFYWDASLARTSHNGGTIISPSRDLATEGLSTFLSTVTDTDTGCWVRIRDPKTYYITWFGAKGEGDTFDDSPSFSAIADIVGDGDTLFLPAAPVHYHVGGITWPVGANMTGIGRRRIYVVTNSADLSGTGAVLWNMSYSSFIDFGGANQVSNINFDGRNRTINGISNVPSTLVNAMQFFQCSITRFDRGFGTALTLNNSRITMCHAANNNNGFYNLVDSHVFQCEINDNEFDGINSQSGANDTTYIGNKVEWNKRNNYRFVSNTSNVVVGGVCDRAGEAGFYINSAEVQISTVKTRRSGRFVLGQDECAHYFVEGASAKAIINNVLTSVGDDDGGGGDITPDYTFSLRGSAVNELIVTGGDADGCNVAAYTSFNEPTSLSIRNVKGITDVSNLLYNGASEGQSFIDSATTASISPAATAQVVINNPPISTNSRQDRRMSMVARNAGTGGTYAGELAYTVRREGASATVLGPYDVFENVANSFGSAGTDNVQIIVNTLDVDAETITFDITNNAANTISVELFWK